jgi:hypothetical protein
MDKGMDSYPPGRRIAHAAADWAAWMASPAGTPTMRRAAKEAVKASLAPVVSAAATFSTGYLVLAPAQ